MPVALSKLDTLIPQEHLLAEVEDLLRTMPAEETMNFETDENYSWLGGASAIIEQWNKPKGLKFNEYVTMLYNPLAIPSAEGLRQIMIILYEARTVLRMRTLGPTNVSISRGYVFDYFDEVRKIIEFATLEHLVARINSQAQSEVDPDCETAGAVS